MAGDRKTIAARLGYHDVVEAIMDPRYLLSDKPCVVPLGCSVFEGIIGPDLEILPRHIEEKYLIGLANQRPTVLRVRTSTIIPRPVTSELMLIDYQALQPNAQQPHPDRIWAVKVPGNSVLTVEQMFADTSEAPSFEDCIFRGLPVRAGIYSSLRLLIAWNTSTSAMEFGPGIYTTPHFGTSVTHCHNAGGILVFRKPGLKKLKAYMPQEQEWVQLVQTNIRLDPKDTLPEGAQTADVIIGPMSENYKAVEGRKAAPRSKKSMKNRCEADTTREQWVFSSHDGIKLLAQNLIGVVYIE